MNYSYPALRKVIRQGPLWSPDGKDVHESLVVPSSFPMGHVVGRDKMNPRLGFMEGLQLVGGTDDRKAVLWAAPKVDIAMFTGMSFYGPRVKDQVPTVIKELLRDQQSRRAVLTVANDPVRDIPINEEPCTIAIQFLVRGALHVVAYLRSSDVVWGVPYDIMQFSMLGLAVACCLNVTPGNVFLVGGSTHEYTATADIAWNDKIRLFQLDLPGTVHDDLGPLERWGWLTDWARRNTFEPDRHWTDGRPQCVVWVE